jgi:DNA-binding NtrC family response regulator
MERRNLLKSLSLGVFEYVNKPVKAKELGRIVKAALESSDAPPTMSGKNVAAAELQR